MLYFEIRDVKNINPQLIYKISMLKTKFNTLSSRFRTLSSQICSLITRFLRSSERKSRFEPESFRLLRGTIISIGLKIDTVSALKLKLLSITRKKTMTEIIETLIEDTYNEDEDKIAGSISKKQANREYHKIIDRMRLS
jgi:hypothetical protein